MEENTKAYLFSPFSVPLSRIIGEGTSHLRIFWPASGEGQEVLPAHTTSQIPLAYNIQNHKLPYFGVACPKPCHSSNWNFPKKFHSSKTELVDYPITHWICLSPGNKSVLSKSCLISGHGGITPTLGLYTVWLLIPLAFKKGLLSCIDFCQFSQDPIYI